MHRLGNAWKHLVGVVTALLALGVCPTSQGYIYVWNDARNETISVFPDFVADFGPPLPSHGLWGHVFDVGNACDEKRVPHPPSTGVWIALIIRYYCNFEDKVYNAQRAGYSAAIVYNNGSDDLIQMHGNGEFEINIPSVFASEHSGSILRQYSNVTDVIFQLKATSSMNVVYFIILACVAGMGILLGFCIVFANWMCQRARKKMSLLSKRKLKKLPVHRFQSGDPYDTCAICLEEYVDGDKLRILPCSHAYHCKCVDPWLTEKMNTCPLCKDVVGRQGAREAATSEERRPLLSSDHETDEEVPAATAGVSTTAEVHSLPVTTRRSYGSVTSSSPSQTTAVINEDISSDRDDCLISVDSAEDAATARLIDDASVEEVNIRKAGDTAAVGPAARRADDNCIV